MERKELRLRNGRSEGTRFLRRFPKETYILHPRNIPRYAKRPRQDLYINTENSVPNHTDTFGDSMRKEKIFQVNNRDKAEAEINAWLAQNSEKKIISTAGTNVYVIFVYED
jgi:hypothetical protein